MKRIVKLAYIVIILFLLVLVPVLTALAPRETVSFYEQRYLEPFPALSVQSVWSGDYFTGVETWFLDHIVKRDDLLKSGTKLDMQLGRVVVNNIVVNSHIPLTYHGFTFWNLSYLTQEAASVADRYDALNQEILSYGGYFCYLGLPEHSSYFASAYPSYMDSRLWHTDGIRAAFGQAMAERSVPYIDMYAVYEELGFPPELYFETDHHFTYRGAYTAYQTLMNHLDFYQRFDSFDFTALPNPFLGSSNRKLYGLWETGDRVEIASFWQDIPFTRYDNGELTDSVIFHLPQDDSSVATYAVYMGGDIGETVIRTNRPELPSILIYGDSFTNPLETLLWRSFDEMRSLDFRYYSETSLLEYIRLYRPDIVVCVRDEISFLSPDGNGLTE